MKALYDDSLFGARFKDPAQYMRDRRQSEQWVREEFVAKGGQPQETYPIPMVLGTSPWMAKHAPDPTSHGEIRIHLSTFTEYDVSFTYPDSMISHWFGRDKPKDLYLPDLHGKVFTISEILSLVAEKGLPEEDWKTNLPSNLPPYIEAQVWSHKLLDVYKQQ